MKKTLLLMSGALLLSASAMQAQISEPKTLENALVNAVSYDGNWIVSAQEYLGMQIIDLANDVTYAYEPDAEGVFDPGYGHAISNNGVVVGTVLYVETPMYWEKGQFFELPVSEITLGAWPNCVSADGNKIFGSAMHEAMSVDAKSVMVVPVVWTRQENGLFGPYDILPYPTQDWTGRLPQYVQIVDCNEDGTMLAGELVSYTGMEIEPLLYNAGADGDWSFKKIHPELINVDGIEFGPYPGDAPDAPQYEDFMTEEELEAYNAAKEAFYSREQPDPADYMTSEEYADYQDACDEFWSRPRPDVEDFMSDDQRAAYEQAMEDYWTDPDAEWPDYVDYMTEDELAAFLAARDEYSSAEEPDPTNFMTEENAAAYTAAYEAYEAITFPEYEDFMTEEEMAAYNKANEKYLEEYEAWEGPASEWEAVYDEAQLNANLFIMNQHRMSANGNYTSTGALKYYANLETGEYGMVGVPFLFDNLTDEVYSTDQNGIFIPTAISDSGAVLATSGDAETPGQVYASLAPGEEYKALIDILEANDAELYEWGKEAWTHTVLAFDEDGNEIEVEAIINGMARSDKDFSFVACSTGNFWDWTSDVMYYSYIVPMDDMLHSGIENVSVNAKDLKVSMSRTGVVTIAGDASSLSIYDLNGRRVFHADKPGSTVSTGLKQGVYLIKATRATGKSVVAKAII